MVSLVRLAAYERMPLLQRVSTNQTVAKHPSNLLQSLVLVHTLHERKEVEMERARLLCLDATEQCIRTSEDTTLGFSIAAIYVLAGMVSFVAMRALWAHPYAEQARKDDAGVYVEPVRSSHGIACQHQPPQILWKMRVTDTHTHERTSERTNPPRNSKNTGPRVEPRRDSCLGRATNRRTRATTC